MRTKPAAERRQKVAGGASPGLSRPKAKAPKGRKRSVPRDDVPFALTISTPTGAAHSPFLREHLRRARPLISSRLRDLHIILVTNQRMADLHRRFLGLKGPTDVITFPIELDPKGRPLCGEVYVCVPYARAQAQQRNIPLQHELLLYALHGMLHLSGYDDRTHRDFLKMHRKEDQILQKLGIGNVFAPETSRRRSRGGGK